MNYYRKQRLILALMVVTAILILASGFFFAPANIVKMTKKTFPNGTTYFESNP